MIRLLAIALLAVTAAPSLADDAQPIAVKLRIVQLQYQIEQLTAELHKMQALDAIGVEQSPMPKPPGYAPSVVSHNADGSVVVDGVLYVPAGSVSACGVAGVQVDALGSGRWTPVRNVLHRLRSRLRGASGCGG